jgi:3-oxoadipate enol-lactonase
VLGSSFGGMVALNLAIRHPEVIDRLVLCCTSPGGDAPSYPLHELASMDPEIAFETRMRLLDRRWDPEADEPIPGLGAMYDRIAARPELDSEQLAGLGRQMMARRGHDVVADLGSISAPTLVCAGRYDDIAPVENSGLLVDRIPDSSLRVFDGGHYFMVQDPTAYPAIIEFLQVPAGE